MVYEQFGRDEFQKPLRQLFHMKQMETVVEYIQEFTEVMHSLKAHSTAWDLVLFLSRFVDGLKDEIHVVIIIHQPKDLDAVVSLAQLQEEALEIVKKSRQTEVPFTSSRTTYRALPSPSLNMDKSVASVSTPRTPATAEDKRGQEGARSATPTSTEDRTSALKNYRRSRGLCFVCGEKWGPGHKCSMSVQLHVVQEMLEAMGFDAMEETLQTQETDAELLTISQAAVAGTDAPNTFRLLG